jgi:hypothetical protein
LKSWDLRGETIAIRTGGNGELRAYVDEQAVNGTEGVSAVLQLPYGVDPGRMFDGERDGITGEDGVVMECEQLLTF